MNLSIAPDFFVALAPFISVAMAIAMLIGGHLARWSVGIIYGLVGLCLAGAFVLGFMAPASGLKAWGINFDGLGSLVWFILMPGQASEITGAAKLIEGVSFGALLADKAHDAGHFRDLLNSKRTSRPSFPPGKAALIRPPTMPTHANGGIWSKTSSRS